jgi:hypothetical protein
MVHDWKNDWMKPGTPVTFEHEGKQVSATVGLVSHDAKLALVRWEVDGHTFEATVPREKLQRGE